MTHYDEPREVNKEWPSEERIDVIGTNGNDGDHYMTPRQQQVYHLLVNTTLNRQQIASKLCITYSALN